MKDKIYIGEVLYEVLPANTVIKIGNSTQTLYEYKNENADDVTALIDTKNFTAGYYTVVINTDGNMRISNITVIDPMAQTNRLSELQKQLDDINVIISARINNDNSQLTINNKTLIHEDLNTLMSLKNSITIQVNELKRKMKNGSTGFFKSTIHCR
ncbi:hypothetical protein C2U55_15600 [Enterobacteriaceae bacterium ENNIH3]|nr:hypothetical protein C2U55_15600 [Enterobacteriaceae bacterium ENNIH3]AUV09512.1 hypothetical protein C2U52_26295 [Enterobacteriaceae bacterium ENNIH2]PWF51142.1 hypothetical protein BHT19_0009360 [[Kluyvera] intestini]